MNTKIAGLSLALLALSWDDERYEELPDWDKDAYWHAWIGDQHVCFPKPFFCLAVIVK
ncbi:LPD38 domain-containing protein [Pectobacterium carotovorum]|uniref:LPD38 domain-containing protein n=1 Tax=Pectobacterium carotovorum TaxID=554 RepID=UPI0030173CA5